MDIKKILMKRERTHGDFFEVAMVAQRLKAVTSITNEPLHVIMREALDMDHSKTARICCGDPWNADHWDDKAGYALLVAEFIRSRQKEDTRGKALQGSPTGGQADASENSAEAHQSDRDSHRRSGLPGEDEQGLPDSPA